MIQKVNPKRRNNLSRIGGISLGMFKDTESKPKKKKKQLI